MSNALHSHGTTFAISTDGGTTFNKIAEVRTIGGPSVSLDTVDVSHLESPQKYREFIGGLKDGGEVTLDVNFIPGSATAGGYIGTVDLLNQAGVTNHFELTWSDNPASVWSFEGQLIGYNPTADRESELTFSLTFKVSGNITMT